jgi:hypothetical protein
MLTAVVVLMCLPLLGQAQPTYKLDVKADLKPLATVKLDGSKFVRSALQDDPGFRLQWHFKKDDKTIAVVEARSSTAMDLPEKAVGTYTVVLELFYPNYKGGTAQKGEFKAVSAVTTFKVEASDPLKISVVETPAKTEKP